MEEKKKEIAGGKQKQRLIYHGIYISNQRKKGKGGRIKCQIFENKIEIFGLNPALHESEVQWEEVRRYKRGDNQRYNTKQTQQQYKKNEIKGGQSKDKQIKKKVVSVIEKQKEEVFVEKIKGAESQRKKQIQMKEESQNIRKKYKLKEDSGKIKKEEKLTQAESLSQSNFSDKQKDTLQKKQEEDVSNQIQEINSIRFEKQQQQKRKQGQQEEQEKIQSEQEQDKKKEQLQIIVGRIFKEVKILYKTQPFVGILNFQRKRNHKEGKWAEKQLSPVRQILKDFYTDIMPIHLRLPIFQLDGSKENEKVLNDYAEQVLGFDPKEKRKGELNRILDGLSSVYVLAAFSRWDIEVPLARISKVIGKTKTIDGECECFLHEHGLNGLDYKEEEAVKAIQLNIKGQKRVDRMVFTIDPATSTDLDDALSIQRVGDCFQIGIHIADVTSYLHLIDRAQIAKRTTSVYLPHKVYHMLPSQLVKICSLDPGVDRLAFTIWLTMNERGQTLEGSRIQKNIIKSRFKLSYQITQDILTGKMDYRDFAAKSPCSLQQYQYLLNNLLDLVDLANKHRDSRILFDVFENKELDFRLDKQKWPVECYVDRRFSAKRMVQEYMILGNIQAAKHLVQLCPNNALVIHHPKPSKLGVAQFNTQFKSVGVQFIFEDVKKVQEQLLEIQNREDVMKEIKEMVYFRARRIQEAAIYRLYSQIGEVKDAEQKGQMPPVVHFALGLQFYTHFTSPMRRMADILVHEALGAALQGQQVLQLRSEEIEGVNLGRRHTKRLKKDLNEVYLCLMIFRTGKAVEAEGIVSSYGLQSVSIYIPTFDLVKQVMWKKQFDVYSVNRISDSEDIDVKVFHHSQTAKKDIYWVLKKFQRVKLVLNCTDRPPLRLKIEMEVQSENGPFVIHWLE